MLQFWFEFASTYSYLAASRIESSAARSGVTVEWKPFLLGPIFQSQGWNDSPFNIYPAKGRYMWRDLERSCERAGIAWRRPSQFPRNGLLAARVACVAAEGGWCAEFTRRVYLANFAEDRDVADASVIGEILEALRQPAAKVLASAQTDENKQRLRRQTEDAARLGIFGAPSFVVDGELFWGNDRLESAIERSVALTHDDDPRELALVAPELFVPDVDPAIEFYVDKLGFELMRREPDGSFAIVALGEAIVMLAAQTHYGAMGGGEIGAARGAGIDVRFVVPDVDAIYERCRRAGVTIALDIGDRYYGLRDFIVRDGYGYRLRFAAPLRSEIS